MSEVDGRGVGAVVLDKDETGLVLNALAIYLEWARNAQDSVDTAYGEDVKEAEALEARLDAAAGSVAAPPSPTALEAADELYEAALVALDKAPAWSVKNPPVGVVTTEQAEWARRLRQATVSYRQARGEK